MIYIIVPTFARVEETKKFLHSIQQSIQKDYLALIIDDHPEKHTYKSIHQNSNIKVMTSDKEIWWVGSINLGIKLLLNEYSLKDEDTVVFANNDIQIDKSSFNILFNELKKDRNQILHPRTFDQNNYEVSSGAKIITLFPYITKHPINFLKRKKLIDMGTARFLMMSGTVLKQVGSINSKLIQYGGDNDFTLSAKKFHNINTYILRDASCKLDDTFTGMKNHNIQNIKELYNSFFSIKSPNNFNYRYKLFSKFFGRVLASLITLSMSFNTVIKFFIRNK